MTIPKAWPRSGDSHADAQQNRPPCRDRPECADTGCEYENVVEVRVDHRQRGPRLDEHQTTEQHGELEKPFIN